MNESSALTVAGPCRILTGFPKQRLRATEALPVYIGGRRRREALPDVHQDRSLAVAAQKRSGGSKHVLRRKCEVVACV